MNWDNIRQIVKVLHILVIHIFVSYFIMYCVITLNYLNKDESNPNRHYIGSGAPLTRIHDTPTVAEGDRPNSAATCWTLITL